MSTATKRIVNKLLRKYAEELLETGNWIPVESKGHYKIKYVKNGKVVIFPLTPSDRRTLLNCKTNFK